MSFFKAAGLFHITGGDSDNLKLWLKKLASLYKLNDEDSELFAADNLITIGRNQSFLKEKKFVDLANKYFQSDSLHSSIIWRIHILAWAINHCKNLDGDLVEFGCYDGKVSKFLIDYCDLKDKKKSFYLYDIFDNPPTEKGPKHSSNLYSEVKKLFSNDHFVKIKKGLLPDAFESNLTNKFAFVHMDLNSAKTEIALLKLMFRDIVKGGILILDDYGSTAYKEQHDAENIFFDNLGYGIVELPTGQGMVIKK